VDNIREVIVVKIAISGWYGARNLGDEAILTAMLESISSELPNATFHVFSKDPNHTAKLHSVESSSSRLLSVGKTLSAIKECDAFILGGGGFLHKYSFSAFWMSRPTLAQMMRKPVTFYSLGLDSSVLQRRMARWLIGRTANRARLITVRDNASRDVLVDMGVRKEVHVTIDPVLSLKPCDDRRVDEILKSENIATPFALVCPGLPGFSMQRIDSLGYKTALAGVVDHIVRNLGLSVVLVPFKLPEDLEFCMSLKKACAQDEKVRVLEKEYTPKEVLGLFTRSQFGVCARYHANIFAIVSSMPCVSIMYIPGKHEPLLTRAGIAEYGLPIQEVSSDILIEKVIQLIQSGKTIKDTLSENLPLLESAARANSELFSKTLVSS
jgi:polysaccharide pyruvyl transferase CsaB